MVIYSNNNTLDTIKNEKSAILLQLDSIDKKILEALQKDGQISNLDLADQVALSPSACSRRVKALEDQGYIERYAALLNPKKVDLNLMVMVSVTLKTHDTKIMESFESSIKKMPEVIQCYLTAGQSADYVLKAVTKDLEEYQNFLLKKLTKIKGVTSVQSVFVLKNIVNKTELPLKNE